MKYWLFLVLVGALTCFGIAAYGGESRLLRLDPQTGLLTYESVAETPPPMSQAPREAVAPPKVKAPVAEPAEQSFNIPGNKVPFDLRSYDNTEREMIFYDSTLDKLKREIDKQPEEVAKLEAKLQSAKGDKRTEFERRLITLKKVPIFGQYNLARLEREGVPGPQGSRKMSRPKICLVARQNVGIFIGNQKIAQMKNIGRNMVCVSYLSQSLSDPVIALCPTYQYVDDWNVNHYFTPNQLAGKPEILSAGGEAEMLIFTLSNGDRIIYSLVWDKSMAGYVGGGNGGSAGSGEGGGSGSGGGDGGGCGGSGEGSSGGSRGSSGEAGSSGGSSGR